MAEPWVIAPLAADGLGNAYVLAMVPVRLQLQAENGQCWEATYDIAGALRNDPTGFDGRAD